VAATLLPLPPIGTAVYDASGVMTEPWRRYFLSLENFTGTEVPPIDAQYWVSTSNPLLTNERNIGALTSGYLKVTTAIGIATPSTVAHIPGGDLTNATVTNAKLSNMVQARIKGRSALAGTGMPQDLTGTEATVILDAMVGDTGTGGLKGLAPAPAAGDAAAGKYLKSDGTWTLPPGPGAIGVFTTTSTGTVNNLSVSGAAVLRCNNATDLTITGIVAGVDGQQLTIVSVGAGNVYLQPENTGSSAANRLKNIVTSGFTPLTAGSGRCTYVYEGTTARWLLVAHEQGSYLRYADVPGFNGGDFTGNGSMTWTLTSGDVEFLNYKVVGKQLYITFSLVTTSVGGTPNTQLQYTLPNGYTMQTTCAVYNTTIANDNGTIAAGTALAAPGVSTTQIVFRKAAAGNWTASANNTAVQGTTVVSLA
jgi:hypothetical protein